MYAVIYLLLATNITLHTPTPWSFSWHKSSHAQQEHNAAHRGKQSSHKRRLISRTCPLIFLQLANHLLVTAWKSTTSQFQSHPPALRATGRALTRRCNWWELKCTLRYFSVKNLSGKSYRCHITFQCCEICNLMRCSFSVKYSRVRSMAPEQHCQMV